MNGISRRLSTETVISLVIVAAVLAVFGRALEAGFVEWDDNIVYDNPHIRGLDWERIRWMFTDLQYLWRYMPLTWLSWAITYELFGLNPFGYHLGNLVLHSANAVLVFFLLRKLFLVGTEKESIAGRRNYLLWCCGLGALLWAIHPLRVEPVVWVTDLVYCQALFFLLISMLCYLDFCSPANPRKRRFYWCSVGAFAASLLSYQTGLGYLLVLVLLDFWPLRRIDGAGKGWWRTSAAMRLGLEKIPFAAVAGLVTVLTLVARFNPSGQQPRPVSLAEFGIVERVIQAFYIWAYYIWKPWFPTGLSPVYTSLMSIKPMAPRFILSLLAVVALTILLGFKRRRWPLLWTLWICHLLLLIPVLGLTEHPHYPNDRYSFIVSITWSVLAAAGLLNLWRLTALRRLMAGVVVVILVVLGVLSYRQSRIWQDGVRLHEYIIAELGNDALSANLYLRLGRLHVKQGNDAKAADCFKRVLELSPNATDAHCDLGTLLQRQGKLEEAIGHYQAVLSFDPDDSNSHNNLGAALAAQGKLEEAVSHLNEALRLDPGSSSAHRNLARALALLGRTDESKTQERQADMLETRPKASPR